MTLQGLFWGVVVAAVVGLTAGFLVLQIPAWWRVFRTRETPVKDTKPVVTVRFDIPLARNGKRRQHDIDTALAREAVARYRADRVRRSFAADRITRIK